MKLTIVSAFSSPVFKIYVGIFFLFKYSFTEDITERDQIHSVNPIPIGEGGGGAQRPPPSPAPIPYIFYLTLVKTLIQTKCTIFTAVFTGVNGVFVNFSRAFQNCL